MARNTKGSVVACRILPAHPPVFPLIEVRGSSFRIPGGSDFSLRVRTTRQKSGYEAARQGEYDPQIRFHWESSFHEHSVSFAGPQIWSEKRDGTSSVSFGERSHTGLSYLWRRNRKQRARSEERRVGKEGRCRGTRYQ